MEERRRIFMKKSVLRKGIVVLLVIALLAIGFSGCGTVIPPTHTTGTVDITVTSAMILGKIIIPIDYTYDIYMDGTYFGTTNNSWNLTRFYVPVGWHTFEAFSNFGPGHGSTGKNISSGINHVTIFVPPIII
jgi:hypothetical protein